jgi:hypothetical protein
MAPSAAKVRIVPNLDTVNFAPFYSNAGAEARRRLKPAPQFFNKQTPARTARY